MTGRGLRRRTIPCAVVSVSLLVVHALAAGGARAAEPVAPAAAGDVTSPQAVAKAAFGDDAADKAPLPGQLSSRFRVDVKNPEASVPSASERDHNPLEFGYFLQDVLEFAEQARKVKDYQAVIRYYRAIAKAVPENAKGWSKLCEAYEIVNDRERAIRACRYAIDRPAAEVLDFVRYVHLLLRGAGDLSPAAQTELNAVFAHLDKQEGGKILTAHLRCETGVKLKDAELLDACTKVLAALAPDDPKTVVFQWSLAMMKGQIDKARDLLIRARATGVVKEGLDAMEQATRGNSWFSNRGRAGILVAAGFLVLAAVALLVAIKRRRSFGDRGAPA